MARRDERRAANEARARVVNEERREWFRSHERVLFACECYDPNCSAMISLSREEYERVRKSPTAFAIHPRHIDEQIEYVAARFDNHWITEKGTDAGARVATDLDPRSD